MGFLAYLSTDQDGAWSQAGQHQDDIDGGQRWKGKREIDLRRVVGEKAGAAITASVMFDFDFELMP